MPVKGVDISEMNGNVNFQALKAAGIQFVIIRCGYGSDYINQDDECFAENVRKADAAGIPWGVYLYSYAKNTSMAKSEAAHTLRLLAGKKPAYGVWYDVEDPQQANADLVSICETYCKAVKAAGCYCGIYSMLSWLTGKLNSPRLDKYDKWVAQWNSVCKYTKPYGIWQYTDNLVIGGKAFDGNWAYKDYPALTGKKKEDDDMLSYEEFKAYQERYEEEQAKKTASQWAKAALAYGKEHGIMVGDEKGNQMPQSVPNRQEVMMMLYAVLCKYRTVDDLPEWGKATIQRMMDLGVVAGAGKDSEGRTLLNMSLAELRMLCFMERYFDAARTDANA